MIDLTNIDCCESVVGEGVLAVVVRDGDGDSSVAHPARELGSGTCVLLGEIIKHLLINVRQILIWKFFLANLALTLKFFKILNIKKFCSVIFRLDWRN